MTKMSHPPKDRDCVLVTFSGPDKPGITHRVAEILAQEACELLDIGQSVLNEYLMLSCVLRVPEHSATLKNLLFEASEMGLSIEVKALTDPIKHKLHQGRDTLCVTMLGDLSNAKPLHELTQIIAQHQLNILKIGTLTLEFLRGIELVCEAASGNPITTEKELQIRNQILALSKTLQVDLALQKMDLYYHHRRMVCMDVDSTLVDLEVIDELARIHGVFEKVAPITEAAMQGKLKFEEALRKRVALLEGLSEEKFAKLTKNIPLMPGAEHMIKTLKSLGFRVGVVSGGFRFFVDQLKNNLGLDFAFANELEVRDGKLTGQLVGDIVTPERKAQVLKDMAHAYGLKTQQCIAIGDGANDKLMIELAGLGIAFHAKPKLEQVADLSIHKGGLDSLLYLLGIHEKDHRRFA